MRVIASVIFWANGMLTVFGDNGAQLPEYQGRCTEKLGDVLKDAPPDTRWYIGSWRYGYVDASRSEFESLHRLLVEARRKIGGDAT